MAGALQITDKALLAAIQNKNERIEHSSVLTRALIRKFVPAWKAALRRDKDPDPLDFPLGERPAFLAELEKL